MTEPHPLSGGITVGYRIRFDECGADGAVRTSALLRYAQDVAWIHSEQLGFDRAWYVERGLSWVVRAAELGILAPASLGDTLTISTAIIGFRKVWARRRTEARLADGTLALWGHTDWVMVDGRGMPGRVPPEFPARFAVEPGPFEPGRVPLPPTPADAHRHAILVRPQDVDPMGHVNNAVYLDYLEEAVLGAGDAASGDAASVDGASVDAAMGDGAGPGIGLIPRRVRLEYLQPAAPGSTLTAAAWAFDDEAGSGWAWRLTDDAAAGRELARGRILAG